MSIESKCKWCGRSLDSLECGFMCDRCYEWRLGVGKSSSKLTESELRDLEEYSRFIYDRPISVIDQEIEEISQRIDAIRRANA